MKNAEMIATDAPHQRKILRQNIIVMFLEYKFNSTEFKNLVIEQSVCSKSKNDLASANRWRREKASSNPLVPLSVGLSSNLLDRFDIF